MKANKITKWHGIKYPSDGLRIHTTDTDNADAVSS